MYIPGHEGRASSELFLLAHQNVARIKRLLIHFS